MQLIIVTFTRVHEYTRRMILLKTIGFPRMHKEINEKRDFLPSFFDMLKNEKVQIFLEEGYGSSFRLYKRRLFKGE